MQDNFILITAHEKGYGKTYFEELMRKRYEKNFKKKIKIFKIRKFF